MPSSADRSGVGRALDQAHTLVARAIAAHTGPGPVILIDGRSGAGKSTLAGSLVHAWPGDGVPQLLALDSVYPGWDGLAAGAAAVVSGVLTRYRSGLPGVWRRWDWGAGRPAEEHTIEADRPLVIEGCGLLTAEAAGYADVGVWLESPAATRRARALARDGDAYRPHWERWAAQEEQHIRTHDPAAHATHVVVVP